MTNSTLSNVEILLSNVETLLSDVQQIIKIHKEHANKQGENFNIFSILQEGGAETKHSYFIYELLKPKGKHGQGDIFLKSFLNIVLGDANYKTTTPRREVKTKNGRIDFTLGRIDFTLGRIDFTLGRIDFTLENADCHYGIEMKIHALDGGEQLKKYHTCLADETKKNNKKFQLFYLTLDGREASKDSASGLEAGEGYFLISFEEHILDWIEDCIKESAQKHVLREALIQYKILIEKLTGKNMTVDKEIIELIKTKGIDAYKSAHSISKAVNSSEMKKYFHDIFWQSLYGALIEEFPKGSIYTIKNIYQNNNNNKIKKYYGARNREGYEGITISNTNTEKALTIKVNYNVFFRCTDNAKKEVSAYPNKLVNFHSLEEIELGTANGMLTINKNESPNDTNNHVLDLLDDNKRKDLIASYVEELKTFFEITN